MSHVSTTPVQCLPPEILSHIFITCLRLTWTPEFFLGRKSNPRLLPLKLASVCRLWREVALNTSEIWSTCWLRYEDTEFNTFWLSRASKQCLLDINGVYGPDTPHFGLAKFDPLLDSLAPFIPRCQSFAIDANEFALNQKIQHREYDAPHLVSGEFLGDCFEAWFLGVLRGAPNLQRLRMDLNSKFPSRVDFALPNLTHLQLRSFDNMEQLLSLLKNAPKLSSLIIEDPVNHYGSYDTVTHDSLKHLTVWFAGPQDIPIMLNPLRLPSLRTLGAHLFQAGFKATDTPPLFSFFQRSQCALQELETDGRGGGPLISILQQPAVSSSLEALTCSNTVVHETFLTFMCNAANLPELRALTLGEMYKEHIQLLVDMLCARGATELLEKTRLERVRILSFADLRTYHEDYEELVGCIVNAAGLNGITIELPLD